MPDAEQRDIAEALFEPKQSREEIKNAIKLEEACACRATKPPSSPTIASKQLPAAWRCSPRSGALRRA